MSSTDVITHYDRLLADHYSWMVGLSFADKVAEQRALLTDLGCAGQGGLAVDLGCGPGYQAAALAQLGYDRVLAVDTSTTLLAELARETGGLPVEPVLADLASLDELVPPGSVALVSCMGDTVTHLDSRDHVRALIAKAAEALAPGGLFVLTFRDLSMAAAGLDRFIPVRADADRIMTCFLEFEAVTVLVHDLIHVRSGETWSLHKSAYRKLRLPTEWLTGALEAEGFQVRGVAPAGRLTAVVAVR